MKIPKFERRKPTGSELLLLIAVWLVIGVAVWQQVELFKAWQAAADANNNAVSNHIQALNGKAKP